MADTLYVIGGGAAGFFCAVNAAQMNPRLKVTILEKSSKLLSKVKISGGGRCNVTHACFEISNMVKKYPRGGNFLKKVFHQFFTADTIQWFKEKGVELKAEGDGRMFPVTDASQTIIDCLLSEAAKYGVGIRMNYDVKQLEVTEHGFKLTSSKGSSVNTKYVCIACGGFPKTAMFDWLTVLGHTISNPVPSLFTFNSPGNSITELMGVSVADAKVSIAGTKLQQQGAVLITHWGISGPAVLRLSAWAARELSEKDWQFAAFINWIPGKSENEARELFQLLRRQNASQKIHGKPAVEIPARLWQYLLQLSEIGGAIRWADLPAKNMNRLIKLLTNFELPVSGKTTYKDEFVTAGGITLAEIDAHTLMSKKVPNLFFAGEIIDVDGVTGGFNFQNAWSTGYVAAKTIAGLSSGNAYASRS